jgi:hypothetical protein
MGGEVFLNERPHIVWIIVCDNQHTWGVIFEDRDR